MRGVFTCITNLNNQIVSKMKLSRAEKLEQERQALREEFKKEFLEKFDMTEKQVDECFDAIQLICAEVINDYMRRKREGLIAQPR